jgi:hypothetical protein
MMFGASRCEDPIDSGTTIAEATAAAITSDHPLADRGAFLIYGLLSDEGLSAPGGADPGPCGSRVSSARVASLYGGIAELDQWILRLRPGIVSVVEPKGVGMEDLRAREAPNVGEQDLKFALTGIGICVVIALALMIFG